MKPEEIRKLIKQEVDNAFLSKNKKSTYENFGTPRHVHNGKDSPKINQADVVPGIGTTGSMTFATSGRQYKVKLTFNPTQIFFNGVVTNGTNRFMIVGSAYLGKSFYLQSDSVDQVVPGPYFNVIQSCTAAAITGVTGIRVHEGHLVRAQTTSSVVVAELTIPNLAFPTFGSTVLTSKGYEDGFLYLDCYLAAGYSIVGNLMIT